jgi:hypothetical protein
MIPLRGLQNIHASLIVCNHLPLRQVEKHMLYKLLMDFRQTWLSQGVLMDEKNQSFTFLLHLNEPDHEKSKQLTIVRNHLY